jgi:P4 family phage/plasmid primase-like protien
MSVASETVGKQRHSAAHPCPVCGGCDQDQRGEGRRCFGFTSDEWIHCSREDHANGVKFHETSRTYSHRRQGDCRCGVQHGAPEYGTLHRNGTNGQPGPKPRIDKVYGYRNEANELVYEVLRKIPKGFSQRRPDGAGGYAYNLNGIQTIPYNLPAIRAANPGSVVIIVEGEKDVDRLTSLELLATCNSGGAGKWLDRYSDYLTGMHVVILADNDEEGRSHADKVQRSLEGKAESVAILDLPGLPPKGDVSDYLDAGATKDALVKLIKSAIVKVVESRDDPHRLARVFQAATRRPDGIPTTRFHRGQFSEWCDGAFRSVTAHEMAARETEAAKREFDRLNRKDVEAWLARGKKDEAGDKGKVCPAPEAIKVTTSLTRNIDQALRGVCLLGDRVEPPAWLISNPPFPADGVLPTKNALVHLPSWVEGKPNAIHAPTPAFFCPYALDYDFDPNAPPPQHWLAFLASVWPNDDQAIAMLQEWLGYLLTPDTAQQKILLAIGPPRSGRGTTGRLARELIGHENVAAPTLMSLTTNFGLAPMIGKPVAIVGDARISGRTDSAVIVERLLSISGEDTLTIDRKHLPSWTGKLPTRLMVFSNEEPGLRDQSGALASRYLLLRFRESFLGREDKGLGGKLKGELPGILLWAIEGWKRLRDRGHFVQPASGNEILGELRDLGSPVGAFVRERCDVGTGFEVGVEALFAEWFRWCEDKRRQAGNTSTFGRDLRTVIPAIETKGQRGDTKKGEKQFVRHYQGVRLKQDETGAGSSTPY